MKVLLSRTVVRGQVSYASKSWTREVKCEVIGFGVYSDGMHRAEFFKPYRKVLEVKSALGTARESYDSEGSPLCDLWSVKNTRGGIRYTRARERLKNPSRCVLFRFESQTLIKYER